MDVVSVESVVRARAADDRRFVAAVFHDNK